MSCSSDRNRWKYAVGYRPEGIAKQQKHEPCRQSDRSTRPAIKLRLSFGGGPRDVFHGSSHHVGVNLRNSWCWRVCLHLAFCPERDPIKFHMWGLSFLELQMLGVPLGPRLITMFLFLGVPHVGIRNPHEHSSWAPLKQGGSLMGDYSVTNCPSVKGCDFLPIPKNSWG